MAITCSGCSATISDQARFCPACGRQLEDGTDAPWAAEGAPEPEPARLGWTVAVFPIIAAIVALLAVLHFGGLTVSDVGGEDSAPAASNPAEPAIAEPGVAAYIREIMAKPEVSKFIEVRQWEGSWIVEVQVKGALSDPEIEGIVRSITTGVHNHSSNGNAQVQAFVGGIKVAVGDYSNWDGSIRVKMLR